MLDSFMKVYYNKETLLDRVSKKRLETHIRCQNDN